MKVLSLLVLITIFAVIESSLPGFTKKNCSDYGISTNTTKQGYSKDFCASLHVRIPTNKCCYLKYKNGDNDYYNCIELSEQQFWNIEDEVDILKQRIDVKNLICDSSSYLTGSLLLFLLYLF